MSQVKEVYVEASFTKNIGNYQSIKPTAGVTLVIEPGEDYKEVYKNGWDIVGDQVQSQLALFDEAQKAGVRKGL